MDFSLFPSILTNPGKFVVYLYATETIVFVKFYLDKKAPLLKKNKRLQDHKTIHLSGNFQLWV